MAIYKGETNDKFTNGKNYVIQWEFDEDLKFDSLLTIDDLGNYHTLAKNENDLIWFSKNFTMEDGEKC